MDVLKEQIEEALRSIERGERTSQRELTSQGEQPRRKMPKPKPRSRAEWAKAQAAIKRLLRRWREPEGDDPYALVSAPKKPRPPHRSAAAAEPLE
jgi:hypothetical protein